MDGGILTFLLVRRLLEECCLGKSVFELGKIEGILTLGLSYAAARHGLEGQRCVVIGGGGLKGRLDLPSYISLRAQLDQ